jgi:hypothetical protein
VPRTCLACSSSERTTIDKAIVSGEPLRNIAKRVSISPAALIRHKPHVAQGIVKAAERQGERREINLLEEGERIRQKAWELLCKLEAEGDHRGSVVALREVRECLDMFGNLLSHAGGVSLAGASDAAILCEAQRRGLRMPVTITVKHDLAPIRNSSPQKD